MTSQELNQLYWLQREIEMDERRLRELEESASSPKSPKLDDSPRAPGYVDRMGEVVAEIVDLQTAIEEKRRECVREQLRLEAYIAEIPDSLTRQIFVYRFQKGMTWRQVAESIGGKNTEDSVRMVCARYLAQENEEN